MTRDEVAEKAKKVVIDALGVEADAVKDDARWDDDLGADSLDRVELSIMLEEEFGVEVSDEDANSWETFGQAVDGLTKLVNRD